MLLRTNTPKSSPVWLLLGLPMVTCLALPAVALVLASSPGELLSSIEHPQFAPAFFLSLWTSISSLLILIIGATPLAWWLANSKSAGARLVTVLVDIPVVLPPAVVGIALLHTFGRQGLLGGLTISLGVQIPFTTAAVIIAQVVVAAPFYIQAAVEAFRRIDDDLFLVARTLGQSHLGAVLKVALPMAWPGLLGGAAIAWARGLGEFGATLLFAGNLPGVTQTMPLAIYMTLESDVRVATALSLTLAGLAVCLIFVFRIILQRGLFHWAPMEKTK